MLCLLRVYDRLTMDEWDWDDGGNDALQDSLTECIFKKIVVGF